MRACKPLPYGQLTTALVPTTPASFDSPLQAPRLEKHFRVSSVLIRLVIGELLLEVGSQVSMAWSWLGLSCMCFA